jgi:hypothetical protein
LNRGQHKREANGGLGYQQSMAEAANLWNNYVLALPKSPSSVPTPGYGITDVLYGPRERMPLSSGLLGPVQIVQEVHK